MKRAAGEPVARGIAWIAAIREPRRVLEWSLAEWEWTVRVARRLRLLARLEAALEGEGLSEAVPKQVRRHLVAAATVSRYRGSAMLWALERIHTVLAADGAPDFPCVLLKGAAYVGQRLPIAVGRLPSDVDILVPRAVLAAVQHRLAADGWQETSLDAHDQRYYREWSHELPPMRHPLHPIELDLHHDLLPPVAKTHIAIDRVLARLRPAPALPGWHVLQPVDQVLHSAAHLFLDSEARDRIRDLVDIDGLLRHFGGADPVFAASLVERAHELGLTEPLALAAHFCTCWLGTPLAEQPRRLLKRLEPRAPTRWWLLPTLVSVLTPADPDRGPSWTQSLAAGVFFARHHAGRLPLHLLVPHIWHKLRSNADVDTRRSA